MALTMTDQGFFMLSGAVTFDSAAKVAAGGKIALEEAFKNTSKSNWQINLSEMTLADSSALSVFLSWMRFAERRERGICFSNIPELIKALAQVSDVYGLIQDASCEIKCGKPDARPER